MSREWEPGDLATSPRGGRVMRTSSRAWVLFDGHPITLEDEPRPLVVIDPEDREQVERLVRAFWDAQTDAGDDDHSYMQAALRSLIAPSKPEEPQGLGAVVEYDGSPWVGLGHHRWLEVPADRLVESRRRHWRDFPNAVRVLGEGWSE